MILDKVIGSVFMFILHGSNGYHESLRLYDNNTLGGYRVAGLASDSSGSDVHLGQDGYVFNANNTVTSGPTASPLILTPYIKQQKFQEGIEAAKVTPLIADIESYSGFLEVNERYKLYMFFWYFPPVSKEYVVKPDTPVIVWVQGGMGKSGMYGALHENGPIRLEPNGEMVFNKWSWAERAHVVYFDSSVGAGYSFTKSEKYATNLNKITNDLYTALKQFLSLFQLSKNPFFIIGQAYAGKTVSALGAMVHHGKRAVHINFQGVAIGNGFVDPPNMLKHGKLLYQLGFIGEETRNDLHRARNKIQTSLKRGLQKEAMELYTKYIQHGLQQEPSVIDRETALLTKLNFTQVRKDAHERKLLEEVLNNTPIQNALHAAGIPFHGSNSKIIAELWPDLLKSQVHNLKLLMNNYRVLLYHGQMSVKNAYPLMLEYLRTIRWRDVKTYRRAERTHWKVDGELAGYFKTGGNFTELLMRNAGCYVSADQPKWAQRMINNFVFGKNLNDE